MWFQNMHMVALFAAFVGWIAEYRVHTKNKAFLVSQGATSFGKWSYKAYYGLVLMSVLVPLTDGFFGNSIGNFSPISKIAFVLFLAFSQTVRWFAIDSINRIWTFTGYSHEGIRRWSVGPYKFVGHPEFLTRMTDGLCYFILFGGGVVSIFSLSFLALMSILIIRIETHHFSVAREQPLLNQKSHTV